MGLKRILIGSAVIVSLAIPGFAKSQNSYNEIINKMVPPSTQYSVKVKKNSLLKGFHQLNVSIKNRNTGVIFHRYLWVSKDKKLIIPVILKYENGKLIRIEPKIAMEQSKTDISWLNNILKVLPNYLKQSIGKGTEVYLFTDPYCPFCKREVPRLLKLAKNNKIKLHIIPFDVHGPQAAKASALFLHIEKNKGIEKAINTIEAAEFSKVTEAVKSQKDMDKIYEKYKPMLDKILRIAYSHGINGTPAMVIKTGKNQGYVILGLQDISKYIKK